MRCCALFPKSEYCDLQNVCVAVLMPFCFAYSSLIAVHKHISAIVQDLDMRLLCFMQVSIAVQRQIH